LAALKLWVGAYDQTSQKDLRFCVAEPAPEAPWSAVACYRFCQASLLAVLQTADFGPKLRASSQQEKRRQAAALQGASREQHFPSTVSGKAQPLMGGIVTFPDRIFSTMSRGPFIYAAPEAV